MKQALIIGGIAAAVIGLGILLFVQDAKNRKFTVEERNSEIAPVGEEFSNLGQTHINSGEEHGSYNSNPPTSGGHLAQPAKWGVYQNELPDEQLIHNLEHGGIWISYKDIDQETKAKLETIGKANPGSVIVTPRAANDAPIALAAWTRLEKLQTYDETKILEFIRANKNKSPEPIAN